MSFAAAAAEDKGAHKAEEFETGRGGCRSGLQLHTTTSSSIGCQHSTYSLLLPPVFLSCWLKQQKHKEVKVKLVQRTKKNQRKMEHRARMAEKAQLLLGDAVMADAPGAAAAAGSSKGKKRARGKKQVKAQKAGAAGASDAAAAAAEVMQE